MNFEDSFLRWFLILFTITLAVVSLCLFAGCITDGDDEDLGSIMIITSDGQIIHYIEISDGVWVRVSKNGEADAEGR